MVSKNEPKLHTVCEITGFEQIFKSLGEYKTLIQTMFIQHIDTYFSFWIFYHSFTYQTVSTNYHTYCTCFKGLPNLPPNLRRCPLTSRSMNSAATPALSPHDWQGGEFPTPTGQFLPEESWDQNWWFGDPKKKTAKKTHPNRSFIAGSNDPCRVS